MKVLLDEQLPVKLKYRLQDVFEVSTVRDENWLGIKNGELLKLCADNNFSVFITNDKNLYYQQKLSSFHLIVININQSSNRYNDLLPAFLQLKKYLPKLSITKKYFIFPDDFQ